MTRSIRGLGDSPVLVTHTERDRDRYRHTHTGGERQIDRHSDRGGVVDSGLGIWALGKYLEL